MASYVVMEPPVRDGVEQAVLVRDGFHVLAFIFPAIWLLVHRLWLEAVLFVVLGMAIGGIGSWSGNELASGFAALMLALAIGHEASTLKLAAMRRRGWREWGVVEADNAQDAETRYLGEAVADEEPATIVTTPAPQTGRVVTTPSGPVLGMLGYPGRG